MMRCRPLKTPWQSMTAGSMLHAPCAGSVEEGENLMVPLMAQAPAPVASAAGTNPRKGTTRPNKNATGRFTPAPSRPGPGSSETGLLAGRARELPWVAVQHHFGDKGGLGHRSGHAVTVVRRRELK